VYSLEFNSEQEPNRDSSIGLLPERDQLGMQRISVDWRPTSGDLRTAREAVRALAEDFESSGCGRLLHDPDAVEAHALRDGAMGGHHIGTTRIGGVAVAGRGGCGLPGPRCPQPLRRR
jgi:hypothetical protein